MFVGRRVGGSDGKGIWLRVYVGVVNVFLFVDEVYWDFGFVVVEEIGRFGGGRERSEWCVGGRSYCWEKNGKCLDELEFEEVFFDNELEVLKKWRGGDL